MTPGARLQAAIELLDRILESEAPADAIVSAYLRERRYIGAGDRREVIERTYAVLRRRAALGWWIDRNGTEVEVSGRTLMIVALALLEHRSADRIAGSFDGGRYRPKPLSKPERLLAQALDEGNRPPRPAALGAV